MTSSPKSASNLQKDNLELLPENNLSSTSLNYCDKIDSLCSLKSTKILPLRKDVVTKRILRAFK